MSRVVFLIVLLLAVAAPSASAAVCERWPSSGFAPVRGPAVSMDAGDLGIVPGACPGTEVSLELGGALTVAIEEFYGGLSAAVVLRGGVALSDRLWLTASAPGVVFDLLANATITATSLRPTATTLGVHYAMFGGETIRVSPYLQVLVPTDGRRHGAVRAGMSLGASFAASLHENVQLTGGVAFPVVETVLGDRSHGVSTPTVALDIAYRPRSWFAVLGGLGVRFRSAGDQPLESLDPRLALRFFVAESVLIDLALAFPVVGRDLTDTVFRLGIGWSMD